MVTAKRRQGYQVDPDRPLRFVRRNSRTRMLSGPAHGMYYVVCTTSRETRIQGQVVVVSAARLGQQNTVKPVWIREWLY